MESSSLLVDGRVSLGDLLCDSGGAWERAEDVDSVSPAIGAAARRTWVSAPCGRKTGLVVCMGVAVGRVDEVVIADVF